MSPLELVKAARKAHGESTEVGSATDLWGGRTETDSGTMVSLCFVVSWNLQRKGYLVSSIVEA